MSIRRPLITSLMSLPAVVLAILLLAGLAVQTVQPEQYYSEASSQYATSLIAKTVAALSRN